MLAPETGPLFVAAKGFSPRTEVAKRRKRVKNKNSVVHGTFFSLRLRGSLLFISLPPNGKSDSGEQGAMATGGKTLYFHRKRLIWRD